MSHIEHLLTIEELYEDPQTLRGLQIVTLASHSIELKTRLQVYRENKRLRGKSRKDLGSP